MLIGDAGDKFYIVLKGSAWIFIPKTEEEIQHEIKIRTRPNQTSHPTIFHSLSEAEKFAKQKEHEQVEEEKHSPRTKHANRKSRAIAPKEKPHLDTSVNPTISFRSSDADGEKSFEYVSGSWIYPRVRIST